MVTISNELRQLGVQVGVQNLPLTTRRARRSIEQIVDGRLVSTPAGSAYIVETIYPPTFHHGHAQLCLSNPLLTIASWLRDTRLSDVNPNQLLFVDTETTGLAGGTGTLAFLIGLGRFENDAFRLTQLFMRDPSDESAVLAELIRHLEQTQALVTFNGKAFDIPLLSTRFILNRVKTNIRSRAHIDLLPMARRLWRDRLESRALGSLEQHILGARRAAADVSGWEIPTIYAEYLRTGDASQLRGVFYHNAMDIVSMAGLLNHTAQIVENHRSHRFEHGIDLFAVGKLFEALGRIDDAISAYTRALEFDLSEEAYRKVRQRLAMSEKRRGHFDAAMELWREAAQRGDIDSCVEIAKHCEHRLHDIEQASKWTSEALTMVSSVDAHPNARRLWHADLERRMKRLQAKLGRVYEH